ncbi:MAG: HAD-IA family hydrolase [Candidatus Dependentiae bacterium]
MCKKIILLAFLLFQLTIFPATIIFDLNGVLVYQNKLKVCLNAGLYTLARYVLTHGPFIKNLFTTTLNAVPYDTNVIEAPEDQDGNALPPIMIGWLKGEIDGNQLVDHVEQFLASTPECCKTSSKKRFISSLARAVFAPKSFAQATCFYKDAITLVKSCKAAGHKVYILSNWDKASFEYIQQWYPEFCELFDGIEISGNIDMIKPQKEIYEYIINKYNLDPTKTAFIDDQRVNIRTAKDCHLFGIQCTQKKSFISSSPDTQKIRNKINAWLASINEIYIN